MIKDKGDMYRTEQEAFWAGDFGDEYINRNNSEALLYSKVALFATMLRCANRVLSARELGCNIGLNLVALKKLNPKMHLFGYEINRRAALQASEMGVAKISTASILEKIEDEPVDLTYTCGVLIHINPDELGAVYRNLVEGSRRYVLVAEYYNSTPVAISYRGHENKLFKRDFAGELIREFGLELVDYGFVYRQDNWMPQDDITWFLMEKR